MTSPRRRSQKSMSMSGSDTRSGFRKRSKMQVVVERIDVGDAQAVGDEAAGRRAAARADGDAVLARVADEVPDDQEVARVLHPLDHRRSRRRAGSRTPSIGAAQARRAPAGRAAATAGPRSPRARSARSTRRACSPAARKFGRCVCALGQVDVAALGDRAPCWRAPPGSRRRPPPSPRAVFRIELVAVIPQPLRRR